MYFKMTKYFPLLMCGVLFSAHSQTTSTLEPTTTTLLSTDFTNTQIPDNKALTNKKLSERPSYPPQIEGLKSEATSNPIVIVDKTTLFVPNLRFDSQNYKAHFVVGKGTGPSITDHGILVEDENGSENELHSYQGKNIYLHLPNGTTIDNSDYFAIWSDESGNLGQVSFDNVIVDESMDSEKVSGKRIMRVAKCCPLSEMQSFAGCVKAEANFEPKIDILPHNETHINNESLSLEDFTYQPYFYNVCPSRRYFLDPNIEKFQLLLNGSLAVNDFISPGRVLSQGEYCLENLGSFENFSMTVFVCHNEFIKQAGGVITYIIMAAIIISTICFAIAFVLYSWIIQNCTAIHKKCFMMYSACMCLAFLILVIVQCMSYPQKTGCKVLGFIFESAMVSSFTWLAILSVDQCLLIKNFKEDIDKQTWRFWWYLGVSLLFPLIFLIVGLSRGIPNIPHSFLKPQYVKEGCSFEGESQLQLMFYLFLSISLLVSIGSLAYSKYLIAQNDKHHHVDWVDNSRRYKFMCRRYILIFIMMLVWLIDGWMSLPYYSATNNRNGILMAFNLIEASQGIVILLLFVLNKDAKAQITGALRRRKRKPMLEPSVLGFTDNDPINPCATTALNN